MSHRRALPSRAVVDTSAFFALVNENDASHSAIANLFRRLATARTQFFTTNFIVAETHALVLRKINRMVAARVLSELDSGKTTLLIIDSEDERRAREILARYDDKDFSLTDAMSFAAMERHAISTALTLDRHFRQYGFDVIGLDRD
jgi:predicted nucleic acid-binding protein